MLKRSWIYFYWLFAFYIGIYMVTTLGCSARRGEILQSWETSNGVFRIKVTVFRETGGLPHPLGTFYVFSCMPTTSDSWREIITVRHDDQLELPRDKIRFVGRSIGYLFMERTYAVTVDAGATWSEWRSQGHARKRCMSLA